VPALGRTAAPQAQTPAGQQVDSTQQHDGGPGARHPLRAGREI
jgi:hypothetical protein